MLACKNDRNDHMSLSLIIMDLFVVAIKYRVVFFCHFQSIGVAFENEIKVASLWAMSPPFASIKEYVSKYFHGMGPQQKL